MRMIVALVALATPGLAFAADPNPKATLTCELVDEGRRSKLPAKRVRLEAPVECKLSVAGAARPEPFAARLVTTWTDYDGAKPAWLTAAITPLRAALFCPAGRAGIKDHLLSLC